MPRIPNESVEALTKLAKEHMLSVISRRVILKPKGNHWIGLCPFHSEKSPSFNVTPGKTVYKCFGCGKSGSSAITFLMDSEGLSYPDALREIAKDFNYTGPLE